ncbi:hypothetical protein BJV74DRAFT_883850 [Russula compacta]|nr:hypothetical protein BJV74DRAFT_883850 [Russula compacta]
MSSSVPSSPNVLLKHPTAPPLSLPSSVKSLPSPPSPPRQNSAATLRPLYTRAVRAFLHRDIVLTHSLLTSAFALITPPLSNAPDSLTELRRKWDVLRITLDVTVYTAPPADTACIPAALRSNALLSATALLATLHTRSVRLFAPADGSTLNSAFLPAQVLVTLSLSSAKIGCPAAGRGVIEEWLACRVPSRTAATTPDEGYEKVLEVYLLNILPALGEWAYARQFLGYETELPAPSRERLATSLASLLEQYLASLIREQAPSSPPATAPPAPTTLRPIPASPTSAQRSSSTTSLHTESSSSTVTPTPSRPSSPTPSSSSASSNSTHTAVPTNPHPSRSKTGPGLSNGYGHGHTLVPLTPTPSSATLIPTAHDTSPRASSQHAQPRRRGAHTSPARKNETTSISAELPAPSWHLLTRATAAPTTAMPRSNRTSSLIELVHAALRPYIRYAPLFLLCVVLPALAVFLRFLRRHRPKSILSLSAAAAVVAGGSAAGAGTDVARMRTRAVEDVRRRLSGVQGSRGLLGAVWDEAVRAIWDTVAMGGRGLV